ncbi:MAG: hypothetical protein J2P37_26870 [Ktedonobacteraceae bacterium]|nr:hypothetical protein [Ktedonobacteraceae bacterium]MBO0791746.1 hypothetical protein [Ktedonobacteraceae bacterium]
MTSGEDKADTFYLGIDGGGSKTLAVIVNTQGHELGRGQAGSSNYTAVGLQSALNSIHTAVQEATQAAGCSLPARYAWLGLAGVDRPADHDTLYPHLTSLASHVQLSNDAELAFSVLENALGVALIAGTGSIALGRDARGTIIRSGGWGHILGDEGSGYDLGRQALLAAVRSADGRGPQTQLLHLILDSWGLHQAEDLISAVYASDDKARIARLSSCVFAAARASDHIAEQIIEQGAAELALAVKAVYERLDFAAQPLPLALCGGLLLNEELYRERLLHHLRAILSLGRVVEVQEPALSAARAAINLETIAL